jgi:four helix bundle protein
MYLKSYKELEVWKKSIELVKEVYIATSKFPKDETYGLSIQLRRAAVSIPSNIAEGHLRKNLKEFLQFLRIAYGSSAEIETQLIISKDLYPKIDYEKAENLLTEIQKMLRAIIKKLEDKQLNARS